MDTGLRTFQYPCQMPGCRDQYLAIVGGLNKRERDARARREHEERKANGTNLCLRHSDAHMVPTSSNRHITETLVIASKTRGLRAELYAVPINDPDGRQTTFEHGPGFRFYADELPVGARVTFTVEVDLTDVAVTTDLSEVVDLDGGA